MPITEPDSDPWQQQNNQLLEQADGLELSLVELVLAASECSEDEGEVRDLVDALVETGKVLLSDPGAQSEPQLTTC
jgi:hypothetical protein